MSGKLRPVSRDRLAYPCCDDCANEFHPSQLRQCATCTEDGSPEFEFCEAHRIVCDNCGVTVCTEHAKGTACQSCAMIGVENPMGDGGADDAYRTEMKNAGRGHLLK